MSENRIADLFRVRRRFLRSANLERDFDDSSALDGYVLTRQASEHLVRMSAGLSTGSGLRAWRVTGDYGVGKSSFALLLSHALGGRAKSLPRPLRARVEAALPNGQRGRLHPVLVTGTREPVAIAVLRALDRSLAKLHTAGRRPKVLDRVRCMLAADGTSVDDAAVVQAVQDAAGYVRDAGHASGVLLVLDELGKFLEYAAASPDRQDVYFLQLLGETAARSGDTPVVIVGLLHQGFSAYADRLTEAAQREWQKVAGRFEEMVFDRPLEQTAGLVADAMNLRVDRLPRPLPRRAAEDMTAVVRLGWYGPGAEVRRVLPGLAPRLYPLHPTVLPVLARLFARYGQNERSLFSFLLSHEPFGLQSFADAKPAADRFYRLYDLYDYVRATLGHRLGAQSYRSHWSAIESVVESFPAEQAVEAQVLKTVAVLNLVDDQGMLPTVEALQLAVQSDQADRRRVKAALDKLDKKRVLYFRGASGGYCLWPHTSVDIDHAFRQATKAVGPVRRVAALIADEFDTRPVVARRHYIQTGNLRHFAVRCVAVDELSSVALDVGASAADGLIVVALCETAEDRRTAMAFARSDAVRAAPTVLVAVPRPLEMLQSMLLVARRWQWVAENTPELAHDRYAAEEVSRQVAAARRMLRDRVQDLVGLRGFTTRSELEWFHCGDSLDVQSGPDLLSKLSSICDKTYAEAPKVRNELVNRRELSSAAAAARMRLIEGLVRAAGAPLLGMDERKKPPEMSMYLSVLRRGKMHVVQPDGTYAVVQPDASDDVLNVRPTFGKLLDLLEELADARVRVSRLFDELRQPPFGVRDGLLPLLLAVFALVHEEELAFYEDGVFVRELSSEVFQRLIKVPASFELQYCQVSGVRAAVFSQLARLLERDGMRMVAGSGVVEVVRPLCQFAAQLPQYVLRTKRLPAAALAVRAALSAAKEPATLIFRDLPVACGHRPFDDDGRAGETDVPGFVAALKSALDDLRGAYPFLLNEVREECRRAFDKPNEPFELVRAALADSSDRLSVGVHEPRLRGFCLRLSDRTMAEPEWLQALAGFVVGKAPTAWLDGDVDRFREELHRLAQLFARVEAAVFGSSATPGVFSARVAVTLRDGSDVARVVHLSEGEEALAEQIEAQVRAVFTKSRRVGLAAVSRALLKELSEFRQPEELD